MAKTQLLCQGLKLWTSSHMTPGVLGLKIKNAENDFKEKKIIIKLGKLAKCFCVLYNNAKKLMFKPS